MAARGRFLPINHGASRADAQRCRKYTPDGMCTPCRVKYAEYLREWRRNNTEARAKQAAYNRARKRAWAALARKYKQEYWQLLDAELKRQEQGGQDGAAA